MINLFLKRRFFAELYTIGSLFFGQEYFCDTLEDKVRDYNKDGDLDDPGETKVYGETAIPYGRNEVIVTYSPKFKRMLPLILSVWGFVGIRIHRGRTTKDTLGCVIVGENKKKGQVLNSKYWEEELTRRLLEYQDAGEKIYINIV